MCGRLASIFTSYGAVLLYAQFGVLGVLVMVSGVLLLLVIAILTLGVDANQYSLEAVSPDSVIDDEPFALQNGDVAR